MSSPFTNRSMTAMLVLLVVAGCHPLAATPTPTVSEDPQPMPEPTSWRATPPNPACATAFAALLAGDLTQWHGISKCTRRDAEDAFGASETFTGIMGPGRRHVPEGTAPMGVHVSYDGDQVFAVAFDAPWTQEQLAPLGPPDDSRASGLGPELRQLTWAERGLIVHRSIFPSSRWLVIGTRPMPLGALQNTSIFNLQLREHIIGPTPPVSSRR